MLSRCPREYSRESRRYLLNLHESFFRDVNLKTIYHLIPKDKETDKDWVDELVDIYLKPSPIQAPYKWRIPDSKKQLLRALNKIQNEKSPEFDERRNLASWLLTSKGRKYFFRKPFELQYKLLKLQNTLFKKLDLPKLITFFEEAINQGDNQFIGELSEYVYELSENKKLSPEELKLITSSTRPKLIKHLAQGNGQPYYKRSPVDSNKFWRTSTPFPLPKFLDKFTTKNAYKNLTFVEKLKFIVLMIYYPLKTKAQHALRDLTPSVEDLQILGASLTDAAIRTHLSEIMPQFIGYHREVVILFFEKYLVDDEISDQEFENLFKDIVFAPTLQEFESMLEHNIEDDYNRTYEKLICTLGLRSSLTR